MKKLLFSLALVGAVIPSFAVNSVNWEILRNPVDGESGFPDSNQIEITIIIDINEHRRSLAFGIQVFRLRSNIGIRSIGIAFEQAHTGGSLSGNNKIVHNAIVVKIDKQLTTRGSHWESTFPIYRIS